MRHFHIILGAIGLMGCTGEYDISSDGSRYGTPNPWEVEPTHQVDSIQQVGVPEVDVLFVVDNSCSMADDQEELAANFPRFMEYFLGSGLDYHIGVVSTDMYDPGHSGRLRDVGGERYVDVDTRDPVDLFASMATMGSSGSADEQGRAAAFSALDEHRHQYNAGFLRKNATMHLIVVSDEKDHSPDATISLSEFIGYLGDLKPDPEMVTFSSIVGPEGGCWSAEAGTGYLEVTDAIGGIAYSICEARWSKLLDQLGMQAAGLKREYFLSQLPVGETIDVKVVDDGNTFGFGRDEWVYDATRNSLTFTEYVPDSLAEVRIAYDVLE